MNLNRILINESEKQRILGMHNDLKKNPTTRLLKEDGKQADFYCASNVGEYNENGGIPIIRNLKAYDGKHGYSYFRDGAVMLVNQDGSNVGNDQNFPGWIPSKGGLMRYWYCKCEGGKCKVATSDKPTQHQCKEPQGQACGAGGGKQGTTPGGQKDLNCKNKTPYNAITDAGLNWKQERQKWIDANCNGTNPCILGNAQTNINLRNAFCDGTWGSKKEQDVQNPSLNTACSSKCVEQPKVVPPGTIVTQQIGYFYDSIQGKCVGVTGQNGPFGSIAECEACKCGSQGTIGDGSQKPNDGGNKLPDFIPPTIVKPIKPLD